MALRVATYLTKGGLGKTTTAAHLAVSAVKRHGLDVVLVDLAGNQNDLAKQFGLYETLTEVPPEDRFPNISHVMKEDWTKMRGMLAQQDGFDTAVDALTHDTGEGPDLIPAHPGLEAVNDGLSTVPIEDRYRVFDQFVTEDLEPHYDLVVLDLPGAESNVALNGLVAGQHVATPVEAGPFETSQIGDLGRTLEELREVDAEVALSLLLANRVDRRTKLGTEFRDDLADEYGRIVCSAAVPSSQAIRNAQQAGHTLYQIDEPRGTAAAAIEAFDTATDELLARLRSPEGEATPSQTHE